MKRHFAYLKYILRHKWFVYLACRKHHVPFVQAIFHDWHKFLPSEWLPYARTFYKPDGSKQYDETPDFALAWNAHQKRGKHHWQYWVIFWDRGTRDALPIPDEYVREMVADWYGAGRAITGKWEAPEWYKKNKDKMILHEQTRFEVERILSARLMRDKATKTETRR